MKLLKSSSSYILLKTGNRVHSNAVTKQLSNQTGNRVHSNAVTKQLSNQTIVV